MNLNPYIPLHNSIPSAEYQCPRSLLVGGMQCLGREPGSVRVQTPSTGSSETGALNSPANGSQAAAVFDEVKRQLAGGSFPS